MRRDGPDGRAGGGGPTPTPLRVLLRQRPFGLYVLGNTVANTGSWFKDIAAAILLYELTGSATVVAGVAVTGYATSLVLAPLGGALADRFDRRRLLVVSHLVQAFAAIALTVVALGPDPSPWLILAATAVIGAGKAVVTPTLHAILPSLVDRRDLGQALTLQSVTFNGTRAVGPLLGALITTAWGPAYAFGLNAAAFLFFVVLLPFIDVADRIVDEEDGTGPPRSHRIRDGVRFAVADRRVLLLLIGMGVVGMGADPVITLGPSFADFLGADPSFAGTLVSAFGIGSLVMAPFVSRARTHIGPVRVGEFGLLALTVGLGTMALGPSAVWVTLGAGIAGVGFLAAGTDLTTVLQQLLPDHLRGRVMALWTVAYLGSRPLAALSSGAVTDRSDPRFGAALIALTTLTAAIVLRIERRRLDWGGAGQPR